jgi:hypothetical protein
MIVEAHGGTIRVVNCAGRGSVFTFSLPAKRDGHTKHPQRNMRRELKRTPARESKTTVAIHDGSQASEQRIPSMVGGVLPE